jgi:hypothetical protein
MISFVIRPLVFLVALYASAQAQPIVFATSGSWSHGSVVTAAGTGFGSKDTPAPVVWDDASGTNLLDKWDGAWPSNNPAFNTAYRAARASVPWGATPSSC